MNWAPVIRILLRYGGGFMVAKGVFPDGLGDDLANDMDVVNLLEIGLGLGASALAEGWYVLAKKFGWAK